MTIGVCYGVVANNLPPANDVVQLYKSKGLTGMRIYFADAKALSALRGSGIGLILDVGGTDVLASLAANASNAANWVRDNVRPYYPAVNIKYIAAGNEVLGGDTQNIVPAMRNLNDDLAAEGLGGAGAGIKVATAVRLDVFANSFPPSAGVFAQSYMTDVARLLASTGAPLLANVYPYFAYKDNPRDIQLNYATFRPGTTVRDQNNGLTYTCLFDAMVDAVVAALERAGAPGVRVVVSESGWPSGGGTAATPANARIYNQSLLNHVGRGTPRHPGAIETYVFSMFNENQKDSGVEQNWGLFYPNMQHVYPISF